MLERQQSLRSSLPEMVEDDRPVRFVPVVHAKCELHGSIRCRQASAAERPIGVGLLDADRAISAIGNGKGFRPQQLIRERRPIELYSTRDAGGSIAQSIESGLSVIDDQRKHLVRGEPFSPSQEAQFDDKGTPDNRSSRLLGDPQAGLHCTSGGQQIVD